MRVKLGTIDANLIKRDSLLIELLHLRLIILVCVFFLLCVTDSLNSIYAQSAIEEDDDVISVRTTEVLLPVTVRDATGRFVTTLKKDDFRVYENNQEQELRSLTLRETPVDVALLVDSSSSAVANLEDFRRAVEDFAGWLSKEDRISLIKFDDRVELLQDWTKSRLQLRRSLRRITPGMFTHFYDALYLAGNEQFKAADRRHAVVVLTDGIDSGRGYANSEMMLRSLLQAQASVYVISNTEIERRSKKAELQQLLSGTESSIKFNQLRIDDLKLGLKVLDMSERNLEQLTIATGGKLYRPESFDELGHVYKEVAEELAHQYTIYYTPFDKTQDGKFRRVRVEAINPALKVTSRMGYFAPKD
jgi:Ca-activated chloride channel homolog